MGILSVADWRGYLHHVQRMGCELRATMWAMLRSACAALVFVFVPVLFVQSEIPASNAIVFHAAHLLDVGYFADVIAFR